MPRPHVARRARPTPTPCPRHLHTPVNRVPWPSPLAPALPPRAGTVYLQSQSYEKLIKFLTKPSPPGGGGGGGGNEEGGSGPDGAPPDSEAMAR